MKFFAIASSATLFLATGNNAFSFRPGNPVSLSSKPTNAFLQKQNSKHHFSANPIMPRSTLARITQLYDKSDDADDEIERLKNMAAQLRAEASKLEAEKAESLAKAAEKAFKQFDTDGDGEISVSELKAGLEKVFKMEVSQKRAEQLMKAFDDSGDGALQLDEFVTENIFRNKLEAFVREEKELAAKAEQEAKLAAEAQALAEARMNFLNEKPPTNSDKLFSVLPYLFPLMDGLQYGRFIFAGDNQGNPIVIVLAILYALYRSIPLSGFVAFFALNFLSNNPSLNRLVRYNMQQAIFVDIALFFPGLISGLYQLILKGAGGTTAPGFSEIFSDVIFVTLIATLAYCSVSSLLGITPDKIPLISGAVTDRMPSIDMFDDQGRFVPREFRDEEKDEEKDKDKK